MHVYETPGSALCPILCVCVYASKPLGLSICKDFVLLLAFYMSCSYLYTPAVSPQQFGKEILADEKADVKQEKIRKTLEAASGAAYGTGK